MRDEENVRTATVQPIKNTPDADVAMLKWICKTQGIAITTHG